MTQQKHLTHQKYRPDIDGLRAMAILSVVIFHAFPNFLKGGFVGVDVFFVISGYLISTIIFENLEKGTFTFAEFYVRRIRRIFPALIMMMSVVYAFGWFALLSDEYKQLGKHIAGGAGFVSNLVLWSEAGYFDNVSETKPLLHLWSLGIEEQFYLIWPFLLWMSWKAKFNLLSVTVLVTLVSFYINVRGIYKHPLPVFYSPHTRFWELLSGSILAWISLYKRHACKVARSKIDGWLASVIYRESQKEGQTLANVISVLGLFLLIYGVVSIHKDYSFPGTWALFPVVGTAITIMAGSQSWVNRVVLSNRSAVGLGLISYPLYLWHWPFLSFARIMENQEPDSSIRVIAVLCATGLATITYRFVEIPLRQLKHNGLYVAVLLIIMIAIGAIGFYTYKSDGFSFRGSIKQFELHIKQIEFTQDLGRPKGAAIMLLGDSHAAHLVPGLKKEFGELVADYTSSGCIPFYGVDRYDNRITPGTCQKAMTEALDYFEKNNQMKVLVLSSMGPVYLTAQGFKGTGEERVVGLGVTLAKNPELTDRWEVYREGLKDTLTRLYKANKKVVFIIDVPELGFDAHSCYDSIPRPLSITGKIKRAICAVSRAEYDNRASSYKTLVYEVVKEFPNVKLYDPTDDFCDEQWCWALRENKILYRDNDHLSNEGSFFIVQHFAGIIKDML